MTDLREKSAAVIGCGGLGCNVLVHLAGFGTGKIYAVDFDTVSRSNLNRQFLYGLDDIGKPKAELAAKRLCGYSENTEIIPVCKKITRESDLDFAKSCDIIILAVDNNEARKTVSAFCEKNDIPLVNGGINGFCGTAYLYIPKKSPCLFCAGLCEKENENIVSVSSTAGIIGALEAELAYKYLTDQNSREDGVLHILDGGEITKLKIRPQNTCGICGRNTL